MLVFPKNCGWLLATRGISTCQVMKHNPKSGIVTNEAESSLWFTTLPTKRRNSLFLREKKKRVVPEFIPKGPAVISCKNEKMNHFSGQKYDKFESVPLVSKGWFHYQSKGDYFTINPTTDHPAFLMTKGDLNTAAGTFEEAGLDPWLVDVLSNNGIVRPTTIQAKAIPTILSGKNTLLVSETGCGKTFAYLLPMVQRIAKWKEMINDRPPNSPLGVIILPNRELALQVGAVAKKICEGTGMVTQTILGGHTKQLLLNPVVQEVDLVVSSLGAISKLSTHAQYQLRHCKYLVLDEADTLFDDSFSEKTIHFLRRFPILYCGPERQEELPSGTQVSLVSATMPRSLDETIGKTLSLESLEKISTKYLHRILPHVPQTFMRVGKSEKPAKLLSLIRQNQNSPAMIFSNKTEACNWVCHFLNENGVTCERINSRMAVDERFGKYEKFKSGEVDVISCTDLTSRGLDTTRVKHVINFDFPLYMADYIHRCGRTGRIGHDENCRITNLISSRREIDLLMKIETACRTFQELHNVNNNITRIIKFKNQSNEAGVEKQEESV